VERERPRNSYQEFRPGQTLDFNLQATFPDSERTTPKSVVIEKVEGGGFFGKVLIPKDQPFVIKTSLPDAPHHLARTAYWGFREFPTRVDKTSAKLEHVGTRIIHNVLAFLTEGRFYSPNSLGYTMLSTGYAQVVEKMEGRVPRYESSQNEYSLFRDAQEKLTKLGFELGLEQVGQIHEGNLLGMGNLWIDPKSGSFIWLDTIPAIPHNGPFILFKFHKNIRDVLGEGKSTFNRIHTNRLLDVVRKNSHLFPGETIDGIEKDIQLYEKLWLEKKDTSRDFEPFFSALGQVSTDMVKAFPKLGKKGALALVSSARIVFDPIYRDKIILSGAEKARKKGIITEEEYNNALKAIEGIEHNPKEKKLMLGVYAYYFAVGRASQIIQLSIIASSLSENFLLGAVGAFAFDNIAPPIARRLGTLFIGKVRGVDLRAAAAVASVPFVPFLSYVAAAPLQKLVSSASKSELIWHYKVRELIASVCGYGSQAEGAVYNKLGKKIENLGSKTSR